MRQANRSISHVAENRVCVGVRPVHKLFSFHGMIPACTYIDVL